MIDLLATCGGRAGVINLPRILQSAQSQLTDDAKPESIGDDRFANFREKARTCSDGRLGGQRVVDVLARLELQGRKPRIIAMDNGPEFTSKRLDQWAYLNGVELDFSRPGKPTDNAMIEAFNARLREECLNEGWFLSLEDAREIIEAWRRHYNGERPHGALGNLAQEASAGGPMTCKTNTTTGTRNGAGPYCPRLTFILGQFSGVRSVSGWSTRPARSTTAASLASTTGRWSRRRKGSRLPIGETLLTFLRP